MRQAQATATGMPANPPQAPKAARNAELRDRLAITIVLLPAGLLIVEAGGLLYLLAVLFVLGVAAFEYAHLFRLGRQRPALPLLLAGVLLLVAAEHYPALNPLGLLPALCIVVPLIWHLLDYERGAPASGTDFAITTGGIFYLGWLGRYFILLRALPDGLWWLLAALTAMWLADTGAYVFGRLFGRRRMAPRLSPKKTWAGAIGSVVVGAAAGALLSVFWGLGAGPDSLLTWQTGGLLGGLVGLLGQAGDLGVSMFKRQMGVKDAGRLIAGHGGALDRIDSWLLAVPAGYFFTLALAWLAGG
jgi:phosphatidate cytidylyltransferase